MQNLLSTRRAVVIKTIAYLYILLFVYAAVSKLLEFNDFQTQLGQSPIFGAIAEWAAYGVVITELLISVLLVFDRTRISGLALALTLMIMFTTYIVIILKFAAFTPCSCGGIIGSLGWNEHLVFNLAFIVLATYALYLSLKAVTLKTYLLYFSVLLMIGAGGVVITYLWSDRQIERNNAFIRKYIPHGLEKVGEYALESNSYYIAGVDDHTIYLGNYLAPLYLKLVDTGLNHEKSVRVEIEDTNLPYKRVRTRVNPPYFFIGDGTVPVIFKGNVSDWKGEKFSFRDAYFIQFAVIDSMNLVIKTTSTETNENALGLLSKTDDSCQLTLNTTILVKQLNGTFDTDGLLLSKGNERIIYIYHYRNAFEVADDKLKYQFTGNTIDTMSRVQLDIALYEKKNQYKLGDRSIMVNKAAATYDDFLFIHTDRLGKYEDDDVLRSAGIIDMYDLNEKKYLHSFYLYHQPSGKLSDFRAYKDRIIAVVEDRLWVYLIKPEYLK